MKEVYIDPLPSWVARPTQLGVYRTFKSVFLLHLTTKSEEQLVY